MTKKQKTRQLRERPNRSQKGQILIIVVFAIVGLVTFVGLVVDTGLVFIGNGRLRRAVDAAALAAASEYRKNPDPTKLEADAVNFLVLNNVEGGTAIVKVCNANFPFYNDPNLCTHPAQRRLVRVDASSTVNLAFLPVIGIRTVTLNATATSEAASLDIVLAMDVSESMTFDNQPGKPGAKPLYLDPEQCNNVPAGDYTVCAPFSDIQHAAVNFVTTLITNDNAYDRVSIIPFDRKAHIAKDGNYDEPLYLGDQGSYASPALYRNKIIETIKSLRVYTGSGSVDKSNDPALADGSCLNNASGLVNFPAQAPCRSYPANDDPCFEQPFTNPPVPYEDPAFPVGDINRYAVFNDPNTDPSQTCFVPLSGTIHAGMTGPQVYTDPFDNSKWVRRYNYLICPPAHGSIAAVDYKYCGTTDTGGAFRAAGNEFTRSTGFRQESLWIVIMLTDGQATHADNDAWCPQVNGQTCQDHGSPPATVKTYNQGTRHCLPYTPLDLTSVYSNFQFLYDACVNPVPNGGGGVEDASAYDVDDYARDMADFVALGQQALIYTIGFGDALQSNPPTGNPNSPGEQLLNYAADIGDDGKIDTPANTLNSDYFYAHTAADLAQIFQTISDRISTRLTH